MKTMIDLCKGHNKMIDIAWADTAAMRAFPGGDYLNDLADWIELELKMRREGGLTDAEMHRYIKLDPTTTVDDFE